MLGQFPLFSTSWAASIADNDGSQYWARFAGVLADAGMTVPAESPWAAAATKARPLPAKYPGGFLEDQSGLCAWG